MVSRFGGNNHNENYGRGVVELHVDEHLLDRAEHVTKRLQEVFNSDTFSPPVLPRAAMEVHRLSQARDVKFEALVTVLEQDPLLAARVLKVASSPVYGGVPLQSLHSAVTRLGLKNLGAIVWEVALNMRVFRSKAYEAPMDAIRRHSIAVAHGARVVAKLTAVPLEYAFLCGLLHDVGAAASLLILGETSVAGAKEVALSADVLDEVLSKVHAQASQVVAKLWKLPPDLQWVLGAHHTVTISGYPHPAASAVAIAEKLVAEAGSDLGAAGLTWENTPETAIMAAQQALNIDARAMDSLRGDIAQMLQNLEQTT
jgi:HD-like signal output (HDOD) protein